MSIQKRRVLQSVRNETEQLSKELTDSAAQQGVALVAKISVFPVSEFPGWATTLATALCENPDLAKEPNHKLASVIEAKTGKKGFNPKVISKNLSASQQSYAADILRQHGYQVTDLVKGTDIKRIVLDGAGKPAKDSATIFFADGVSIDGKVYKYRQRNTTPTGMPWNDFCIRIGGVEVPLQTVLTLRNVGIGEFQLKNEAAMKFASTEQTARRQALEREPRTSRSLAQLAKVVSDGQRKSINPCEYTSSQLAELVRTWFYNVTVVQGNYVCLGDLLNVLPDNPEMLKALEEFAGRRRDEAANDDGAMAA